MFDHTHYVPILRWKHAERGALADLHHPICDMITPLIEPTRWAFTDTKKLKTTESKISKIAEDIFQHWGEDPFFMDFWLVPPTARTLGGTDSFLFMARQARSQHLHLIPVIGLDRDPGYLSAVKDAIAIDRHGACLRLLHNDIEAPELDAKITHLLSMLPVRLDEVDLILDLQYVEECTPDYAALARQLPYLDSWRTFTIAGGSFPKDLQGLDPGKVLQPRWEWRKWQKCFETHNVERLPSFSDYTIQHPVFEEPPDFASPSASIRYTTHEDWIIIRGLSVRRDDAAGYAQWPANAMILCKQPEFMGGRFSSGDGYIEETSKQTAHTGNAESWLKAGFNHHMTFVVKQLANLFGNATVDGFENIARQDLPLLPIVDK